MRFKHVFLVSVAAAVTACSPSNGHEKGGGHGPGGGMPASEVTVMTAATEALPVSWEYVGQTAGSREVEVRARVTGILMSRNFKEGERVKKGQSLFTIDPKPFEAALARAVADLAAVEARLEQATAQCRAPEAALCREGGEPEGERRRRVGRGDRRRRRAGRAGAPHRGEAQHGIHEGRGSSFRHHYPGAALGRHADLGPGRAAHERGAGRPDLGQLRHPGQRAGAHPEGRAGRHPQAAARFRGRAAPRRRQRLRAQGQARLLRRARLARRPARARRAPSCRIRTARWARASSCAWC